MVDVLMLDCDILNFWAKKTEIKLVVCDGNDKILWCNPAFEEFIGYSYYELVGESPIDLEVVMKSDELQGANSKMIESIKNGDRGSYNITRQLIPKNEKAIWCNINCVGYLNENNDLFLLFAFQPMKNGSLAAFNLSMEKTTMFSQQISHLNNSLPKLPTEILDVIRKEYSIEEQATTPVSQIFKGLAKLIEKYPKYSALVIITILIMIIGPQLVQAIETIKKLFGG